MVGLLQALHVHQVLLSYHLPEVAGPGLEMKWRLSGKSQVSHPSLQLPGGEIRLWSLTNLSHHPSLVFHLAARVAKVKNTAPLGLVIRRGLKEVEQEVAPDQERRSHLSGKIPVRMGLRLPGRMTRTMLASMDPLQPEKMMMRTRSLI